MNACRHPRYEMDGIEFNAHSELKIIDADEYKSLRARDSQV